MAFADAFTNAGKETESSAAHGDVVDHFHGEHGLAHTSTADDADLAAFHERRKEVHNLDARFQNLWCNRTKPFGCRGRLENVTFAAGRISNHSLAIERHAGRIDHSANQLFANRNLDRVAAALNAHAFLQAAVRIDVQADGLVARLQAIDK